MKLLNLKITEFNIKLVITQKILIIHSDSKIKMNMHLGYKLTRVFQIIDFIYILCDIDINNIMYGHFLL